MAENKEMMLEIISPRGKEFAGKVRSVKVPGTTSPFQILNMHGAIVSTLTKGKIVVESETGEKSEFEISGGIVENKDNKIVILTNE